MLDTAVAGLAGGDPAPVGVTLPDIERLGQLRAAGALTDAEHKVLKAGLVRRP